MLADPRISIERIIPGGARDGPLVMGLASMGVGVWDGDDGDLLTVLTGEGAPQGLSAGRAIVETPGGRVHGIGLTAVEDRGRQVKILNGVRCFYTLEGMPNEALESRQHGTPVTEK